MSGCARVLLLALALSGPVLAFAQQGTATLQGTVVDTSGGALPGATVTARNLATGITRTGVTDEAGRYRMAALPTGTYEVVAELIGFQTATRAPIVLQVGAELSVELALGLSGVAENVTVTGASPVIEVTRSHVASVIDQRQIAELPLISRNFLTLASLAPGAGRATSLVATQPLQIGGADARSNYTTIIDGGDVDDDIWGAPVQSFMQDSIQEFQVITNRFDAEYGKALEAVINVVSKSGTNTLSGSVFGYARDDSYRSKSYFEEQLSRNKPPFKQVRTGGTLGGPILRDRTHYFMGYEFVDVDQQSTVNINAASPLSVNNGIFPSGNTRHLVTLRADHRLTNSHTLAVRGLIERFDSAAGFGGTIAYDGGRTNARRSNSILAKDTWVIGGSAVNELRFQWRDTTVENTPNSNAPTEERPSGRLGSAFFLQQEARHRYQLYNTLYYTTGSHALKIGGEITFMETAYCACGGQNGRFFFSTDQAFSAANTATWPTRLEAGISLKANPMPNTYFGMFIQDDWRLTDTLTINLGIRWDVDLRVRDSETRRLAFDIPRNQPLRALVSEDPGLDLDNIDPRLGFAWAPTPTLVVRGGYGIYHSRARMFMQALDRDALLTDSFVAIVTDPQRLRLYPDINAVLGATPAQFASTGLRSLGNLIPDDFEIPYAHQVSVGFSKQFGEGLSLNVDAVHSATRKQMSKRIANLPETYSATNRAGTAGNPWPIPGFGQILFQVSDDSVDYSALQVGVNRRMSNRVQGQVSYTWSKAMQEGPNTNFNTPSKGRGAVDRGPTLGDMRHKFSATAVVELPWQFNLSTVLVGNTGPAYRIIAGADLDGDGGQTEDRPEGLAMNQGGVRSQANLDIINAFRRSRNLSPVTLDQLGKRYPYLSVDVRLNKVLPVGRARIELMAEVFNLFNRVNFNNPNGTLVSPAFLTTSSTADPREAQLGIRVRF